MTSDKLSPSKKIHNWFLGWYPDFAPKGIPDFIFGILVAGALVVLIGYFSTIRLPKISPEAERVPIGKLALYEPILSFQKKHSRWPQNQAEFQTFTSEENLEFPPKPYPEVNFQKNIDGTLTVTYVFKAVGGIEKGSFVLQKP